MPSRAASNICYLRCAETPFFARAILLAAFSDEELHFASAFRGGGGKTYRSFPLVGTERLFDISVEREGWPMGNTHTCTRNLGILDQANNATPSFADIRELPLLDGLVVASPTLNSPGDLKINGIIEVERFEAHWKKLRQQTYFSRLVVTILALSGTHGPFLRPNGSMKRIHAMLLTRSSCARSQPTHAV